VPSRVTAAPRRKRQRRLERDLLLEVIHTFRANEPTGGPSITQSRCRAMPLDHSAAPSPYASSSHTHPAPACL
jgi:hypothetical protein